MINVGTTVPTWGPAMTEPGFDALVRIVEDSGVDSVWFGDHLLLSARDVETYPYWEKFLLPVEDDWFDPIVCAAQVAARPSSLDLVFGVSLAAVRPPLELARQVASIARLAGGSKVVLGVGTGWSRAEHEAMGMDFDQRGDALDAAIELIREVWSGTPAAGDYGRFHIPPGTFTNPTPGQHIPILIGGNAVKPLRRAARTGDGWVGYLADWEDDCATLRSLVTRLAGYCDEVGRNIDDVELAVVQTVPGRVGKDRDPRRRLAELFDQYRAIGVTRVTLGMGWHDLAQVRSFLRAAAESGAA